jgi:hypothetical protein
MVPELNSGFPIWKKVSDFILRIRKKIIKDKR